VAKIVDRLADVREVPRIRQTRTTEHPRHHRQPVENRSRRQSLVMNKAIGIPGNEIIRHPQRVKPV